MRLAAGALAILAAGLLLAGVAVFTPGSSRSSTAYVVVIVLGISLFIAAHYYKIVPFLVWYHRFGPLAGRQSVPRVNQLYSARAATVAGTLLVLGTATLSAAVIVGNAAAARGGAMLLAAGVGVEAVQMSALARRAP